MKGNASAPFRSILQTVWKTSRAATMASQPSRARALRCLWRKGRERVPSPAACACGALNLSLDGGSHSSSRQPPARQHWYGGWSYARGAAAARHRYCSQSNDVETRRFCDVIRLGAAVSYESSWTRFDVDGQSCQVPPRYVLGGEHQVVRADQRRPRDHG